MGIVSDRLKPVEFETTDTNCLSTNFLRAAYPRMPWIDNKLFDPNIQPQNTSIKVVHDVHYGTALVF